jgi:hypothetical protein
MRDPHVIALLYKLKHSERIEFKNAAPLQIPTQAFDAVLAENRLRVTLHDHHSSRDAAREAIEPFLRAWELNQALNDGRKDMWFEFAEAEIIDRNPLKTGETSVAQLAGGSYLYFGHEAKLTLSRSFYPAPNFSFVASPVAMAMWNRYEQYLKGREPLPGMAYACLTLLEGTAAGSGGVRAAVCAKYAIAQEARKTLGDLISEKGDLAEGRKLGAGASHMPFTEKERSWIEGAVKRLIRRKGEYDANPTGTFAPITMADLPTL